MNVNNVNKEIRQICPEHTATLLILENAFLYKKKIIASFDQMILQTFHNCCWWISMIVLKNVCRHNFYKSNLSNVMPVPMFCCSRLSLRIRSQKQRTLEFRIQIYTTQVKCKPGFRTINLCCASWDVCQ